MTTSSPIQMTICYYVLLNASCMHACHATTTNRNMVSLVLDIIGLLTTVGPLYTRSRAAYSDRPCRHAQASYVVVYFELLGMRAWGTHGAVVRMLTMFDGGAHVYQACGCTLSVGLPPPACSPWSRVPREASRWH
ncbi:hypothetical protein C8Q78DRAFT_1028712 [Trametes maxima]|nr:hypothetical protein C8Q78DRAFT_1028712 [Trametes maxima]